MRDESEAEIGVLLALNSKVNCDVSVTHACFILRCDWKGERIGRTCWLCRSKVNNALKTLRTKRDDASCAFELPSKSVFSMTSEKVLENFASRLSAINLKILLDVSCRRALPTAICEMETVASSEQLYKL